MARRVREVSHARTRTARRSDDVRGPLIVGRCRRRMYYSAAGLVSDWGWALARRARLRLASPAGRTTMAPSLAHEVKYVFFEIDPSMRAAVRARRGVGRKSRAFGNGDWAAYGALRAPSKGADSERSRYLGIKL